uniref:Large ribosomal subunit protein uL29c n=1 Tax=Kumanoa americana TaxID=1196377 RepID=A0A1C9CGX2_9FLOR|nr:ribosomal protein L29 [Kumanoa americana]AOM67624.1 ribosomal protein L29 [Kumanoa americana]
MKLFTIEEIKKLDQQNAITEIIKIKKKLLDLRVKQSTRQPIKSHLFKLYKKQIAQILTLKHNN